MNANDLMLYAGLGVILFIVLMGIIGFCVGAKREFVWIAVLLLLLGIVWIAFGNVDKILATDITAYAEQIEQMVGEKYEYSTLWELALAYAKDAVEDGEILFVEGSKAYQALYDIVSCVLRAALLIIGTIAMFVLVLGLRLLVLVVRIIIGIVKLIIRICGKRRPKEPKTAVKQPVIEEEVTVTHDNNNNSSNAIVTVDKQPTTYKRKRRLHWWGAGVGIAKAMLILILIFVPISGVVTIATSVSPESLKVVNEMMNGEDSSGQKNVAETNSTIDQVYEYIYAYQDSFLGKFMDSSSFFFEDDLSNIIFEDLLTVELDNHKIVLPEEVILYINTANYFAPMYQDGEFNLYEYAIEHPVEMDEAFELLKQSKLVPALLPVGIEYAKTLKDLKDTLTDAGLTEQNINDIFDTLLEVDWYEDWQQVCDIARNAIVITDYFADEIDILTLRSENLRKALTSLGATHFVNDIMPVALEVALNLDAVKKFVGDEKIEVTTEGLDWSKELANFADMYDCFVKLGIGLDEFSKIDLEYVQELLLDEEKADAVVELLGYLVGAPNGEADEDLNLFAQVILPIADAVANKQLVDNSLEMFADIISLSGEQYADDADFDVKKMWQHDLETIIKLAQLASEINALSLDLEEIKLDDVETLKAIVDELFKLELLGGSIEYKGHFEELKSALLEAAIEKFEFLNPGSDWSNVQWEVEKENIKELLDVYKEVLELNDTLKEEQGLTEDVIDIPSFKFNWDILLEDEKGRFIDIVIKAVEVFFDDETTSELFLTAIPNAVNKYLVPELEKVDSELGELPLFDGLTSEEVRSEVMNLIEVLKDVAALKLTTDSPEYSAKVGENKETYAISDILQRIIKSKLLVYTGGEEPQDYRGRIIRIVLKLATDIDVDIHELDSTLIGGPVDYEGDLNKIDALVTALIEEVVEDDGALNEILFVDGKLQFDMDKFLEFVLDENKVHGVINALEAIFGKYNPENPEASTTPATLLAALLPGAYYAYLENAVSDDFKPILDIKHYNKNDDGIFTGFDLAGDISKLLYALHSAVDLGAIEIYNDGKITESTYEITDETVDGIREILSVLPDIKIFQEKFADVIEITLGLIDIELSQDTKDEIQNEHLEEFVEALNNPTDGVLAKVQGILEETEYIRICDIYGLITNDNILEEIEDKFLSEKVVNLALDAVEQLINIELVGILLPELLDQLVLNKIPDNINTIVDAIDIKSYEATELIEDLVTVIEAARIAINEGDLLIYFYNGEYHLDEIPLNDLEFAAPVFEKLAELNLLRTAGAAISEAIKLLDLKGLEISPETITQEMLAHDFKEVLGNKEGLVVYAAEALKALGITTVGSFKNMPEIKYTSELGDAGVAALQEVAKLEILNAALPELVEFGADQLDEMGYELTVLRQIPDENLDGELVRIAELVKVIYDTNVVNEFIEDKKLYLTKEEVNQIIDKALELHIYRGLGDIIFKDVLTIAVKELKLDINVDNIDTENIDWYGDVDLIRAAIDPGIELLKAVGFKDYANINDFINAVKADPTSYIRRDVATELLNVLDNVVRLESLSRILPEGIRFATTEYLADYELDFLANITPEEIRSDLIEVVHMAKDAVELGAIEFYNNGKFDGDIDLANGSSYVREILDHVANLNIVENNSAEILAFALNFAAEQLKSDKKYDAADFEGYSIREEIKLAEEAGRVVLQLLKDNNLTTVQAIKGFDFNNYQALITDSNIHLVSEVITLITESETVYHALPLGADYASTLMDILAPLKGHTTEELHEDLVSIAEAIDMIAKYGVADAINITLDGNLYNFESSIVTLVKDVLEKVLFLNIVDGSENDFLSEGLKLIEIDDTNVDYSKINWADDKAALVAIFDDIKAGLAEAKITDLTDVRTIVVENKYIDTLLTNPILTIAHDALDKVVNLSALEQLIFPVFDKMVLPGLDSSLQPLADINTIYGGDAKLLVEDLNSIVDIIDYAVKLDAVGIYNGGTIDYQNEAIGQIITTIFGVNYLNAEGQLENVVDYVLDLVNINLEINDLDTIDLAADGAALATIYNEHIAPVLGDEEFMFKTIKDFEKVNTISEIGLAKFLSKNDYAVSLVEGLQKIVELNLGKVALVTGVAYALDNLKIENPVIDALELKEFTKEELASDIVDILDVALIALKDFDALNVVVNGLEYFELPENAEDKVYEMGSLIVNLNILREPTSDLFEAAITTYLPDLDVTSVNFENVTLVSIKENVKQIIPLVFKLLDDTGITGYSSAYDYYETYIETLSVIYETEAVNDVFDIVDLVLDNSAVKELLYAAYVSYADQYVSEFGIDVNSYKNNSSSIDEAKALLLTDVLTVVETAKTAYNFVSGEVITYNDKEAFNKVIDNLFGLRILNDNLEGIIGYVNNQFGLTIDANKIDLANDAKELEAFYAELTPIFNDENWMFKDYQDILDFMGKPTLDNLGYEPLMTSENAEMVLTALHHIVDTTLVGATLEGAKAKIEELIPGEYQGIIDAIGLEEYVAYNEKTRAVTRESLATMDIHSILYALDEMIKFGAFEYYQEHDLALISGDKTNEEYLQNAVRHIFNLNILNAHSDKLIEEVLRILDIEVPTTGNYDYFDGVTFASESATFENVVADLYDLMEAVFGKDVTVATVYYFIVDQEYMVDGAIKQSLITNQTIKALVNLGETLIDSKLVSDAIIPVYNKYVLETLDPSLQDLASLEKYNPDLLREDVHTLIDLAYDLKDENLVEYVKEFVNENHSVTIDYETTAIAKAVETILNLHIIEVKELDLINYAYEQLPIELEYTATEVSKMLDLAKDSKAIGQLIVDLQKAIFVDGFYQYPSDYKKLNYQDFVDQLSKENVVMPIVDALKEIQNTTLVNVAYRLGVSYGVNLAAENIDAELAEIITVKPLSDEEVATDYLTIINVAEHALKTYGLNNILNDIVNFGDANLIKAIDVAEFTLEKVVTLNVLNEKLYRVIEIALNKYVGTKFNEDLAAVNYQEEVVIINQVLEKAKAAITESISGEATYNDFVTWFNNANYIDNNIYVKALEAVEIALTLKTLEIVALPVYDQYKEQIKSSLGELGFLAELHYANGAELITDVKPLVTALKDLKAIDPVGIYLDLAQDSKATVIDYSHDTVRALIETILTRKYIETHELDILEFVYGKLPIELEYTAKEVSGMLNLSEDSVAIGQLVVDLTTAIFTDGFYQYASDYLHFDVQDFIDQVSTDEVAMPLVAALKKIKDTTLVNALYRLGVSYGVSFAAENVDAELAEIIDVRTLLDSQVVEDYRTIIEIAENALKTYGLNNILNAINNIGDADLIKAIDVAEFTLEKAVTLNVIEYQLYRIIEIALNKYVGTDFNEDLGNVKYQEEVVIINQVLEIIKDTLTGALGETVTYNDLVPWFNNALYIDNTVYENALEAVEIALTLKTLPIVVLPVYDQYKEDIKSSLGEYGFLAELHYETGAELIDDVKPLVIALKDLVVMDPNGIYLDFAHDTQDTPIDYSHETVRKLIETILTRRYVETHELDLINLVLDLTAINFEAYTSEELAEIIDLNADATILADTITKVLANVLTGDYKYANAFINFDYARLVEIVMDDIKVQEIVDILETTSFTTTTVAKLAYLLGIEFAGDQVGVALGQRFEKYFETKNNGEIIYTNEQISYDLDILLEVVRDAAKNNLMALIIEILNKNLDYREVIIAENANIAASVINALPKLNFTKDQIGDFIAEYLKAAEVADDIDFSDIPFESEFGAIAKALVDTAAKLAEDNMITVGSVIDKVSEKEYISLVPAAITALDGIIDLQILDKVAVPTVNYLRDNYIEDKDSFIGQMTDINFYSELTDVTLMSELRTVVKKAIDLYNNKLETYLDGFNNDTQLDYELLADVVSDMYETVAKTAYIANKEEVLVQLFLDNIVTDLTLEDITTRLDFASDATVVRNTLTYAAEHMLSNSNFMYHTINEWLDLNINSLAIFFTSDSMIQHTINTLEAFVGPEATPSTISEVAYIFALAYAKDLIDVDHPDYSYVINYQDLTSEQVKADLDVIISAIQSIADNELNANVEAIIRDTFDYRALYVSQLYPTFEIILTNVLGTEEKANLYALDDNVSTIISNLLKDYANVKTDLSDVDIPHETPIILDAVKQIIDLGNDNDLLTIGNYLDLNKGYLDYVTDANVNVALDIVNVLLDLDTIAKHGIELYNEFVYEKTTDVEFVQTYLALGIAYQNNADLVNELKALIPSLKELTDTTIFENGLVSYVKDICNDTTLAELTPEFINELSPAIVKVLKTKLANYDANVGLEELVNELELVGFEATLDVNADADKLEGLIDAAITIVLGDMVYASEVRHLTVNRLLDMFVTNENLTNIANEMDIAAETSVLRTAYNMGLNYANKELQTVADAKFANVIDTNLTDTKLTDDIHSLTTIIREFAAADVETDIDDFRNKFADILDFNLVKYQPIVSTVLDEIASLNAIVNMGELIVAGLDYAQFVTVDDETKATIASINYDTEFAVISYAIAIFVPETATNFGHPDTLTIGQMIDYAKSYRTFDDDYAMFESEMLTVIDTLEALETSELLKALAIPTYDKYVANNEGLASTARFLLALDNSYTSENFANDYMDILSIARSVINAKMYKVIYNPHLTQFEVVDTLAEDLKNIIVTTSTLDFLTINNNMKFIDIVSVISDNVQLLSSLATVKDEFANVNLEAEATLLAEKTTDMVAAFKVLQRYGKNIDLPMLGETEFVQSILNIVDAYLASETHKIITPVLMNDLVTPRLNSLFVKLGSPQEAFADALTDEEVFDLTADIKSVLDLLLEAGVFANGTISLTNEDGTATNEKLVTAYEIMMSYIVVSARIENAMNKIVNNAYKLGGIDIDYSVMSYKVERPIMAELFNKAKPIAREVIDLMKASDFNGVVSTEMEEKVNSLYDIAIKSEIVNQLAIPLVNLTFMGLVGRYGFVLIDEADGVTIDNIMEEVAIAFEAGRKVLSAILIENKEIHFAFANFEQINKAIDEVIGMKIVNGGATDNLEELFRIAVRVVLNVHLSDDVVAMDEIEIIKTIISNANPLIELGVYSNGKVHSAILSQAALNIVADILEKVVTSTMFYEIKDQLIDKAGRFIPASMRPIISEMVKDNSVEVLKADTRILIEALRIAATADIHKNGEITIETKSQFDGFADAFEKLFKMTSIKPQTETILTKVFSKVDLSSLGSSLDPIGSVKDAIANNNWTWEEEIAALANVIRAMGDVAATGVKVLDGIKPDFDAVMNCENQEALTKFLKAINQTESMRQVFIVLLRDLEMTSGSLDITEFYSEWLNNQLVEGAPMAPKAEWDKEMDYITKIYLDSKSLNCDIKTMNDTDIDNLCNVLKQINHSKSFNINAVTTTPVVIDVMSNMVSENEPVKLGDTSTWDTAAWDAEIDNINAVLKTSIKLGATSKEFDVAALNEDQITELFTVLNNSNLTRTMLPIVVMDSLNTRDYGEYAPEWLKAEYTSVTDNDPKTNMKPASEWNTYIPGVVKLVKGQINL